MKYPQFADFDEDLLRSAIGEAARIATEVLHPINGPGDRQGCRLDRDGNVTTPDGYKDAFINDRLMYERFSVPQSGCLRRPLFMGSGRGLGGSGSINAMVYLRGSAADFRAWDTEGWTWADVEPQHGYP